VKLVSFNPYRTLGIPGVTYIKPEHTFKEIETIRAADFLLFLENWQTTSLVYGLKKRIFPSIETIQLGYSKIEMTRALWTVCPENVPYTEILANTPSNQNYILDIFPFPFVAKLVRSSMGNGVFLIKNKQDFMEYAEQASILYVQEYLENDGRDLRVCVVGDEIIGSYWRISQNGDFLHNIAQGGELCFDFIPQDVNNFVLNIAQKLNINHAGFDVLISNGKPYILEFNVLFGNQGLSQQGISIENKIYEYLLKSITPTFPTSPSSPYTPYKGVS
jgi:ribosomal protein S6--L-glutamate ligase